tara:strand:+ start:1772 stop:2137 length:366 start_codon:yes stop_codon:yes gene_type:complete
MKRYTYDQLFKKVVKILKDYNKTKNPDKIRTLIDLEHKYRLRTFFWSDLTLPKNKHLLSAVMRYMLSKHDIVKTLNYYFEHMRKGDLVKEYAILEFLSIAYRNLVPTLSGYPKLYRYYKKK